MAYSMQYNDAIHSSKLMSSKVMFSICVLLHL